MKLIRILLLLGYADKAHLRLLRITFVSLSFCFQKYLSMRIRKINKREIFGRFHEYVDEMKSEFNDFSGA